MDSREDEVAIINGGRGSGLSLLQNTQMSLCSVHPSLRRHVSLKDHSNHTRNPDSINIFYYHRLRNNQNNKGKIFLKQKSCYFHSSKW